MKKFSLIIPIILSFLAGCATTAKVQGVQLGNIKNSTDLTNIAVEHIKEDGFQNTKMKSLLQAEINNVMYNGERYFKLVDLSEKHTNRFFGIQKMQNMPVFDRSAATDIGHATGAHIILYGEVQTAKSQQPFTKSERVKTGCNDFGSNCTYQSKTIRCVKYNIHVTSDLKLVSIKNLSLLESKHYAKGQAWERCGTDNSDNKTDISSVVDNIAKGFATDFIARIAPKNISYSVVFIDKLDVEADELTQADFRNALAFVKAKRYEKAKELFAELYRELGGESYAVAYNLGALAEVDKAYDEARLYYYQAENIRAMPDKKINGAIIRISF